jgi:pyrimidine-nucleoside phosphorylase
MVDLIEHKRGGGELTNEEIDFIIQGYVNKTIPDYQISALLMAIYFQGMTTKESTALTMAMLHSGETIDLTSVKGIKVDKHSTGGVGDKTTLVLGPLVAAAGVKVAKLSGRGLGHTGGTLDKLESIPGMSIAIEPKEFLAQVNDIGIAVAGQTANLCPADKLLYALRDVTATVPSVPLIASSIMSKKLASGSDVIVLDVKIGEGAFMKTLEDARELSKVMVGIGTEVGKEVIAFITDMSQPLGYTVGNKLEVVEAIETLQGNGPDDLTTLCREIGSYMVYRGGVTNTLEEAKKKIDDAIHSGKAHAKQLEFIARQGGKLPALDSFVSVKETVDVKASKAGYIQKIHALDIGLAAMKMGAGRATKDDEIDPDVGIKVHVKVGDQVKQGDVLATLYNNLDDITEIKESVQDAFVIVPEHVKKNPIIFEIITSDDL